ncbi:Geranylgeranyl transferase type II subunit beta [Hyphodiscus hymeniophilus]|uniref:Geranylgeranyl transferase type-2 subunit beta n=1 Tax=Hyphodiscus hymeniophilus TaxID=353542 RepID=A0A9P6VMB4_9HELO|nr:Geranylgeranyl transferase type II subunit beta [Hyphodiscus hymeniophilus]
MSLVSGPGRGGQSSSALPTELQLAIEPHVKYIQSLDSRKDELEYWLTEHLRLNGVYWGLTALHLMGRPDALPRDETIEFVLSCQHDNGGFGAAPGHDAHLLYTVSAVQILATVDALGLLEERGKGGGEKGGKWGVGTYIASLQNRKSGTFAGDEWGEEDTRFLYASLNALSLLNLLHLVDVPKAVDYIVSCANFDGGYGVSPGAESHSGQIFACVAALTIAGRIDLVDKDKLGSWLSERQVEGGGLNGRPEKLEDVCYSWWVASSLTMIGRLHWIDGGKLAKYILECQDSENGGLADRPGDMPIDIYITPKNTSTVIANMPKAVKPEVNIELACSLCPKIPKFSDISHLLTHISSKSHLSHRFKLQIRSQSESEAKEKINEFDFWYRNNNLDGLLAERLASKDKKKTTKERKPRVSNAFTASVKTPSAKLEHRPAQEVLAATPVFRAPIPRMQLWTASNNSSPAHIRDWDQNNMYSTPTMRRQVPNFAPAEIETPAGDMLDSKSATPWRPTESDENGEADTYEPKGKKKVEKKVSSESTILKGVLWPGMDLFDSATPEMKRMRNQRKDESVLEQMMASSNDVEPNEIVYHLNGDVHHIRDIFGPLSTENSPTQIRDPTPKKCKSRKVAALSDISVNAPRIRAPRPRKGAAAETPLKHPSAALENCGPPPQPLLPSSTINSFANIDQRFVPSSEEDDEFRLTVGEMNMNKKRGFAVYQEAPEVSPGGRTESTLEDHRFDFSGDRAIGQARVLKTAGHVSPTPPAKQSVMRGFGKENGPSGFSPVARPRHHSAHLASHVYPGQMFYDPILNPLFDPSFARSFPSYTGQLTGFNDHLKPTHAALPRFQSSLHGQHRPTNPASRRSIQQEYGVGINNGEGMHYGV